MHLADRTSEALEAISKADAMVERSGERWWCAELYPLRGVFLAAMGADEEQIQASFSQAIRIAKEQKSASLENRAEATYVKYHRQRARAAGEAESDCLFGDSLQRALLWFSNLVTCTVRYKSKHDTIHTYSLAAFFPLDCRDDRKPTSCRAEVTKQ